MAVETKAGAGFLVANLGAAVACVGLAATKTSADEARETLREARDNAYRALCEMDAVLGSEAEREASEASEQGQEADHG